MRRMYDSTTARDVPKGAAMVAGYVDGLYENADELRRLHPGATLVTITIHGAAGANAFDTEPGNAGPAAAARWACAELSAGRRPTVYTMASWLPTVRAEVAKQCGSRAHLVSYWVAQYDGVGKVPAGCVAKQYLHGDAGHAGAYSGGHYDVSAVADYWPGVDRRRRALHPTHLARRTRESAEQLAKRLAKRGRRVKAGTGDRRALRRAAAAIARALGIKH